MAKTHGAQLINERDGKWDGEGKKIQRKKKKRTARLFRVVKTRCSQKTVALSA